MRSSYTGYSALWQMAQTIRLGASHKPPHRAQQIYVLSKVLLDRPQIRIEFLALGE
jgi:hypothetical protein